MPFLLGRVFLLMLAIKDDSYIAICVKVIC